MLELYGVEPEQVPDFIALRGDPSDKIPGAKGVGPKTAATVLREHGTLEAALAAGRFPNQAEDLRLYRRIATFDASAPLPSLSDQTPTWAEASSLARDWGMKALSERLAERVPHRIGGVDDWLTSARDAVADAAGIDRSSLELSDADAATILDLARIAAHDSGERTNAPLLCYLVGQATAGGASLETVADAVRKSSS